MKWWIKRLRCQTTWTWIAVGPDRVIRYFASHPEALSYVIGHLTDEFGNDEHAIRQVAVAAHFRGDFEAERIALDRLALMERCTCERASHNFCPAHGAPMPPDRQSNG